MTWPSSPQACLTQLRDQLVACASAAAAGLVAARWHHPNANPSGVEGTGDTVPLGNIERFRTWRTPYADSTMGLLQGEAEVTLYLPTTPYTVDAAEALADAINNELFAQQVGLMWGELTRDDASEASAAAAAADTTATVTDYRTVTLHLSWGIQP